MAKETKISHKDLAYDKSLPPFLQRMQQTNASPATYQSVRHKKQRNAEDDAEDEPVYFDEATKSTLTKNEWKKAEAEREGEKGKEDREGKMGDMAVDGQETAVIGMSRKRKAGKVIGGRDDEGEHQGKGGREGKKEEKEKRKPVKKATKVKLSFGDDE